MIFYLCGAGVVYALLVAASLLMPNEDLWLAHPTAWASALTLGVVPLMATWSAAEAVRVVRRPRVLGPYGGKVKALLGGLVAGVVSTCVGALAVVMFEPARGGYAWLLMGCAAFVSTAVLLRFARTNRRGHCARCGYDLAGVTVAAAGRCPECGLDQMAA